MILDRACVGRTGDGIPEEHFSRFARMVDEIVDRPTFAPDRGIPRTDVAKEVKRFQLSAPSSKRAASITEESHSAIMIRIFFGIFAGILQLLRKELIRVNKPAGETGSVVLHVELSCEGGNRHSLQTHVCKESESTRFRATQLKW